MKVSVVRGGGFAGLITTTTADSEALPPEHAGALEEKVNQSGVLDLPEKLSGPTRQPDRFNFEVTIEKEGRTHKVVAAEEELPENLKSLISWVDSVPGADKKVGRPGRG
jgi:hypothetical protein